MAEKVGRIQFVIKGGQPWGFRLQTTPENRSTVIVDEIVPGGKADQQGGLRVGDHIIKINDIQCLSLADALQLIDAAFRTLTVLVWRSTKSVEDNAFLCVASNNTSEMYDRKSSYVPCHPFNNCSSTLSIYENLKDITYQEEPLSCIGKSSLQENIYENTVNTLLKNSGSFPSSNLEMFPKAITGYSGDNLLSSQESRIPHFTTELRNKSRHIFYCEQKPSMVPKEMCANDIKNLNKKLYFSHSPISQKDFKVNSVTSHCYESFIPYAMQENAIISKKTFSKKFSHFLKKDIPSTKLRESCCMYPNCHNKHVNCKIHSPPERDTAYPNTQSVKQIGSNLNRLHISRSVSTSKDQIKHDIELVERIPNENEIQNTDNSCFMNEKLAIDCRLKQENNLKLQNLHDQFKTSSANNHTEYKLKKVIASNISEPISNAQSMHFEKQCISSQNHFSLSYFNDKIRSNLCNILDPSPLPNYENVDDFHKDAVFSQFQNLSVAQVNGTIKHTLHSYSKSSLSPTIITRMNDKTFLNGQNIPLVGPYQSSSLSKAANFTRMISSNRQDTETDEDEELSEIERNKSSLHTLACSSIKETPPLPSPPPETETEILAYDVPLPPPPLFLYEENACHRSNKTCQITETIYENSEMLQIQCSVVNTSTQTSSLRKEEQSCVETADVIRNCSSHKKKTSPHLDLENNSTGISLQSKFQSNAPLMKSMLHGEEENLSKNSLNLPLTSAYFTTSTPKAKLLTRYTSKLHLKDEVVGKELSSEKDLLMSSITKKLDVLLKEQAALQEELQQNDELGYSLTAKLEKCAKTNEVGKFKLHIEELEKITNLLLSLSGRLARTENALLILPTNATTEEKNLLEAKLCKLNQQYDEANDLQENINQRNNQVSIFLHNYLTEDEFADYEHFIKMKVKLLVDYKELVEKIKLGEEQIIALNSSMKTMGAY